jgi:hypothetical protein
MGDLDTLIEFGFDKERAQLALKQTGSCKSDHVGYAHRG